VILPGGQVADAVGNRERADADCAPARACLPPDESLDVRDLRDHRHAALIPDAEAARSSPIRSHPGSIDSRFTFSALDRTNGTGTPVSVSPPSF
jgi:hypothetical protein